MAESIHPFYASHRAAMEAAMRRAPRAGRQFLSPANQALVREQAARSATASHQEAFPGDFADDFVEPGPGDDFDFGIDDRACGFCKFAARHGDADILPNVCGLDFDADATRGIRLVRTQTLAGGASHCDFRFSRLRPDEEEEKEEKEEEQENAPATDPAAPLAEWILEQTTDALVYADAQGTIARWNPAAERLFGFTAAEARGRSLDLIIPEHLRAAHWSGFRRAVSSGSARLTGRPAVTRALHKSGARLHVEMTFALVKDDAGTVVGSVAIARDVTERVQKERGGAGAPGKG
ncbi:MAG TPA: PAS domain S-box protein [Ramlibacter sp.]|jgi:PAS domain S-box-containing protein|uniref:PAS domain S-box protein n=1 Tax=Ramlibacter sp. TaxID=1917967 RepID=UPI002D55C341|nr:PAS domain S-box protein [Ramlibacter sp.]HZY17752.1 PAS domain S-box protein [Ramlibacter sp.]